MKNTGALPMCGATLPLNARASKQEQNMLAVELNTQFKGLQGEFCKRRNSSIPAKYFARYNNNS